MLTVVVGACSSDNGNGSGTEPELGNVQGEVVNDGGGATPATTIQLSGVGSTRNTQTAANGTYSFTGVEAGAWTVTLSMPSGYQLAQGESSTRQITVNADQTTTVPAFHIRPIPPATTGTINGRVTVGTQGIANVTVALTGPEEATVTTNAGGNYSFSNLDPGTYTVTITVPNGLALGGEPQQKETTVVAGQTRTLDWALVGAGPTITVSLTDASFVPGTLAGLAVGTTVRWVSNSGISHTVTPRDTSRPGVWSSVQLNGQGQSFEHVFLVSGQTYEYFCQFHAGMEGEISVQ